MYIYKKIFAILFIIGIAYNFAWSSELVSAENKELEKSTHCLFYKQTFYNSTGESLLTQPDWSLGVPYERSFEGVKIKGFNYNLTYDYKDFKSNYGNWITLSLELKTKIPGVYRAQICHQVGNQWFCSFSPEHSGNGLWETLTTCHWINPNAECLYIRPIQTAVKPEWYIDNNGEVELKNFSMFVKNSLPDNNNLLLAPSFSKQKSPGQFEFWSLPIQCQATKIGCGIKAKGFNYNLEGTLRGPRSLYSNQWVNLSVLMKTSISDLYKIQIYTADDGISTFSKAHTGSGQWEEMSISHRVPAGTNPIFIRAIQAGYKPNEKAENEGCVEVSRVRLTQVLPGDGDWKKLKLSDAFKALDPDICGISGMRQGTFGSYYNENVGLSEIYQLGGMQNFKIPVFHPYVPTDHERINGGVMSCDLSLHIGSEFFKNLPIILREQASNDGIRPKNVRIFFVTQDHPWLLNTLLSFRPHYAIDTSAPGWGFYNKSCNIKVRLFSDNFQEICFSDGEKKIGYSTECRIRTHSDNEKEDSLIVLSGCNPYVTGFNPDRGANVWSHVKYNDSEIFTLHWLLSDIQRLELKKNLIHFDAGFNIFLESLSKSDAFKNQDHFFKSIYMLLHDPV